MERGAGGEVRGGREMDMRWRGGEERIERGRGENGARDSSGKGGVVRGEGGGGNGFCKRGVSRMGRMACPLSRSAFPATGSGTAHQDCTNSARRTGVSLRWMLREGC